MSNALNLIAYAGLENDQRHTVYSISISESEFMRFNLDNDGSPGKKKASVRKLLYVIKQDRNITIIQMSQETGIALDELYLLADRKYNSKLPNLKKNAWFGNNSA